MQVSELRAVFESLVDDRVSNVKFLYWLREATNTVGLAYGHIASVPVASGDMLPVDFNRALLLEDVYGSRFKEYEILENNSIYIDGTEEYNLYYFRKPALIPENQDSAIPDIPEELHDVLPLMCAATFYDMESLGDAEESAMGTKYAAKAKRLLDERVKILKRRYKRIESFT